MVWRRVPGPLNFNRNSTSISSVRQHLSFNNTSAVLTDQDDKIRSGDANISLIAVLRRWIIFKKSIIIREISSFSENARNDPKFQRIAAGRKTGLTIALYCLGEIAVTLDYTLFRFPIILELR
jgi:type IV secretory pathway TrbD component